jgi:hypothetical protein
MFILTIGASLSGCFPAKQTLAPSKAQLNGLIIREDNARLMKVDKLGYIYVVSARNSVKKFDANGSLLFEYMNSLNGDIEDIDVINPMKMLVFYKDFQQLVCLDNNLALLTKYNLRNSGFQEVSAVGLSNDNHFWIFDQINFTLYKMNDQGKIVNESDNLLAQSSIEMIADQIMESSNFVVLRNNEYLMLLDNFGQWIRNFKQTSESLISVTDRYLYILSNNNLYALPHFDLTEEVHAVRVFQEQILSVGFGDKIYILTPFGVKMLEE